jgi:hypothetical protein
MSTWYLSYNGQQTGPFDLATAAAQAKANPEGYCWRAGMSEWLPIRACAELQGGALPVPVPPPAAAGRGADVIDYRSTARTCSSSRSNWIPGESAVAEAGSH